MKRRYYVLAAVLIILVMAAFAVSWQAGFEGLDEEITGIADSYAREVGAGEREPYINTEKGDLLLFLFAGAGLVCGFYLGYQWHKWVVERHA